MASAKKLPSGAWRTQAKKTINGKKVCQSFTVHPRETGGDSRKAKALSELQAREWQIAQVTSETYGKTVGEAIDDYIRDRSKVLSPGTITMYKGLVQSFDCIKDIYLEDIKTSDIQKIINEWSLTLKTKTIHNKIGFLLSCLDYAELDRKFRLRYPNNPSKVITAPDTEDVDMLIKNAPDEFKPVLCLAAFGALRRGEIAALKQKDISRDMCTIFVHADIVRKDKEWFYKPFPKNALNGTVQLPKFIIDMLPENDDPEAYVFNFNPGMITNRFVRLRNKLGLTCTFHSLRHYAASFRSDLGFPKKYVEEVGRWKAGSGVVDRVYDNTLTSTRKKYTQIANNYIEEKFKDAFKKAE